MKVLILSFLIAAYAMSVAAHPHFAANTTRRHRHHHHHYHDHHISKRAEFPGLNVVHDRYEPCPGFPEYQRYNETHKKAWHFHCWCYKYTPITCDMPWAYGWGSGQYQGEYGRSPDNCAVKKWWGCAERATKVLAHNMGENHGESKNVLKPVSPFTCTGTCTGGARLVKRLLAMWRND